MPQLRAEAVKALPCPQAPFWALQTSGSRLTLFSLAEQMPETGQSLPHRLFLVEGSPSHTSIHHFFMAPFLFQLSPLTSKKRPLLCLHKSCGAPEHPAGLFLWPNEVCK